MTDAKEFYTTITGDDERGRQLADANAEPFDMASLGLHDKPMPEHEPRDGCDEHLTTFPMGGECPDCNPHMMRPSDSSTTTMKIKDIVMSVDCEYTVPMAGETPDTFEAGEPEGDSSTIAASMLRRLADSRWAEGHRDTDPLHAAAQELSRESKPSPGERAAAEVEAELAEITGARVAIREARAVTSKIAVGGILAGHRAEVVETRRVKRTLHMLGYNGDTLAELYEDIKRTAILGNAVSRELLRQDEADKRAMIGERR